MDLWHIIPPPFTLVAVLGTIACTIFSFSKEKTDSSNRNEGLGLKLLSIVLCVLMFFLIFFTEWTDWAWTDKSSRAHRDLVASGLYVEPPPPAPAKETAPETVTISKIEYDAVVRAMRENKLDIEDYTEAPNTTIKTSDFKAINEYFTEHGIDFDAYKQKLVERKERENDS